MEVTKLDYLEKFDLLKSYLKLPKQIPINSQGIKLGNLKIDFEIDREKITPSNAKKEQELISFFRVLGTILKIIDKDIDKTFELNKKIRDENWIAYEVLDLFYWDARDMTKWISGEYSDPYLVKEDTLFDLISSEGPDSLRIPQVLELIKGWLADKNSVGAKLNRLKNSLMVYALGSKDRLIPAGRPPNKLKHLLGDECIREIYRDLTTLMEIIKGYEKKHADLEKKELFRLASKDYISSIRLKAKKDSDPKGLHEKLVRYEWYLEQRDKKEEELFDFVSEIIQNDKELKEKFIESKWSKGNMAKGIIEKLLGIKPNTLLSILYRK